MPIDPTARVLIDAMEANFPPLDPTISGTEMRARVAEAAAKVMPAPTDPEPVGEVLDRTVPGPAGEIPVRIYHPTVAARDAAGVATSPVPTVAFFHGGGFVLCDLDSHDGICRALCNATPAVIVAVHYRRAPEARYPAAVDDCYAVTAWAAEHVAELGGDPARLAVFGDSAGGNLAAAVALMARDRGLALSGQALVYPMLDWNADTASHRETGDDYYLRHEEVMYYWREYLGDGVRGDHPYASPSFATDLSGVAPAFIATAEFDPLRDEGEAFADALAAAGVPATKQRYDGMFHSFFSFMGVLPAATELRDQVASFLRGPR
jgi:acetyl esterase